MSWTAAELYSLLPAIYRLRDREAIDQSGALEALIGVIAREVEVIQEDLEQLYDDQFIETCAEWAVPYIGDLVGVRGLLETPAVRFSQRAFVANSIGYRRRKGTAAMLEQIARDLTGWDAVVVEFFERLATTQHLNHLRPENRSIASLRSQADLEWLNTPLDSTAHTAEVRRIASGRGRYNLPNIGIFLWRLSAFSLTDSPAFAVDAQRYLFSPLGNDTPLFTSPQTEEAIALANSANLPIALRRRQLARSLDQHYGTGKSLVVKIDGVAVPASRISICDLSSLADGSWANLPNATSDRIAIDPVLGRLARSSGQAGSIAVSFHYGFSARIGGGEHDRVKSFVLETDRVERVTDGSIQPRLNAISNQLDDLAAAGSDVDDWRGIVEIASSDRFVESLTISLDRNQKIELRAADQQFPTLVGDVEITGAEEAELWLNGLRISGTVRVSGSLKALHLRHCTLVPGIQLSLTSEPQQPNAPSLIVAPDAGQMMQVTIADSIVGALRLPAKQTTLRVQDSIIDAPNRNQAIAANDAGTESAGATELERVTVIGQVTVERLEASDVIFTDRVRCDRQQEGCVRFSNVPASSQTPRRYRCVDESVQLTRWRYGAAGYGQLSLSSAIALRHGGSEDAEIGAFHSLYQPQREASLRLRLDEYLRFGLEAGLFYVT